MFLIALGLWALTRSGVGTVLSAIRMDEGAVKSSGLNTTKLKLFAFILSALVAGIGGALYTHYLGAISPKGIFDINFLFTILIAALIGGEQSIVGPILGAYFSDVSFRVFATLCTGRMAILPLWSNCTSCLLLRSKRTLQYRSGRG